MSKKKKEKKNPKKNNNKSYLYEVMDEDDEEFEPPYEVEDLDELPSELIDLLLNMEDSDISFDKSNDILLPFGARDLTYNESFENQDKITEIKKSNVRKTTLDSLEDIQKGYILKAFNIEDLIDEYLRIAYELEVSFEASDNEIANLLIYLKEKSFDEVTEVSEILSDIYTEYSISSPSCHLNLEQWRTILQTCLNLRVYLAVLDFLGDISPAYLLLIRFLTYIGFINLYITQYNDILLDLGFIFNYTLFQNKNSLIDKEIYLDYLIDHFCVIKRLVFFDETMVIFNLGLKNSENETIIEKQIKLLHKILAYFKSFETEQPEKLKEGYPAYKNKYNFYLAQLLNIYSESSKYKKNYDQMLEEYKDNYNFYLSYLINILFSPEKAYSFVINNFDLLKNVIEKYELYYPYILTFVRLLTKLLDDNKTDYALNLLLKIISLDTYHFEYLNELFINCRDEMDNHFIDEFFIKLLNQDLVSPNLDILIATFIDKYRESFIMALLKTTNLDSFKEICSDYKTDRTFIYKIAKKMISYSNIEGKNSKKQLLISQYESTPKFKSRLEKLFNK